jgi:hypothetical protein
MTTFHDWEDVRAELHDGDDAALQVNLPRLMEISDWALGGA